MGRVSDEGARVEDGFGVPEGILRWYGRADAAEVKPDTLTGGSDVRTVGVLGCKDDVEDD